MNEESQSFVNRKRPAVEGLIEDIIGPTARLDQLISSIPPIVDEKEGALDSVNDHPFQ